MSWTGGYVSAAITACWRTASRGGRAALLLSLSALVTGCVTEPVQTDKLGPAAAQPLTVLVSDASPAFADIAELIRKRHRAPVTIQVLPKDPDQQAQTLNQLSRSRSPVMVAIGLKAALAAREVRGKRVIFCQVVNHEAHALASPNMKGVSAIPSLSQQFRVWKSIDPGLERVGMITGRKMQGVVAEATRSARANGMSIVHREVVSDKELVYAFKRMSDEVQGVWLVPDNRILSVAAMRELMTYSVKHGKQALVFDPQLLQLGGLLSAQSDPGEIADKVLLRVRQANGHAYVPGRSVIGLDRARLTVNPVMLKRFGLVLPKGFKGESYAS